MLIFGEEVSGRASGESTSQKSNKMRYNTARMNTPIQIIPRIRSLTLENVGCWVSLRLDFIRGVNIITGEPGSLGKTTVLSSIMSEVCPDNDMGLFAPPVALGKSRIAVELMPSGGTSRASLHGSIPPITGEESHGQYIMRLLKTCLAMAEPDGAVIFDDEVLGRLDDSHRSKAVKWLNETTAQVICVIKRLNRDDFPTARVFSCAWDREGDVAQMSLPQ